MRDRTRWWRKGSDGFHLGDRRKRKGDLLDDLVALRHARRRQVHPVFARVLHLNKDLVGGCDKGDFGNCTEEPGRLVAE